jgi:hypothetical protein
MGRTLKAAAAGVIAAGIWAASEPLIRRYSHAVHSEPRLVGGVLAPEPYTVPVGLVVHLMNGAVFGVAFDRLGRRGVVQGVAAAQFENAVLWPTLIGFDKLLPDVKSGNWPPLLTDRRALAHEVAGHAVFGAVLGTLIRD